MNPVTPTQENGAEPSETPSEPPAKQTDPNTQTEDAPAKDETGTPLVGPEHDDDKVGATTDDDSTAPAEDTGQQIEASKEEQEESQTEEADTSIDKVEETETENDGVNSAEPPKDEEVETVESKEEISPDSPTAQMPEGEPEMMSDIDRMVGEADMFEPTELDKIIEAEEEPFDREEAIERYKVL